MSKKGKKYVEAAKQIEAGKLYSIEEAIELVKKTTTAKFDASVDVVFKLNLDTRHADQQLRGAIDVVGGQEILDEIAKGWLEFDVMIATPDQMPKLGKLGRVLGPKGLMPNPKTGTVTMDVAKAVNESKGGKVNYRTDKDGNVHLPIGRVSFDSAKLVENYEAIHALLLRIRPAAVKGTYVKNCVVSSTMGPAVKVAA